MCLVYGVHSKESFYDLSLTSLEVKKRISENKASNLQSILKGEPVGGEVAEQLRAELLRETASGKERHEVIAMLLQRYDSESKQLSDEVAAAEARVHNDPQYQADNAVYVDLMEKYYPKET